MSEDVQNVLDNNTRNDGRITESFHGDMHPVKLTMHRNEEDSHLHGYEVLFRNFQGEITSLGRMKLSCLLDMVGVYDSLVVMNDGVMSSLYSSLLEEFNSISTELCQSRILTQKYCSNSSTGCPGLQEIVCSLGWSDPISRHALVIILKSYDQIVEALVCIHVKNDYKVEKGSMVTNKKFAIFGWKVISAQCMFQMNHFSTGNSWLNDSLVNKVRV